MTTLMERVAGERRRLRNVRQRMVAAFEAAGGYLRRQLAAAIDGIRCSWVIGNWFAQTNY